MKRLKAIWCAVIFSVLPYWVYEKVKHYECSYLQHLWINLTYAFRWMTFTETQSDREFEKKVNNN